MAQIQRRSFLKGSIMAAMATQTHSARAADTPAAQAATPGKVANTPPSLQIPAPTTMGVAWGINALATGFVDVATKQDLTDAQRFFAGDGGGLKSLDDTALTVRLTGLKPDSQYFYRTGTVAIDYHHGHKLFAGEPELGEVHTFRTPGVSADSSFAVINDTHENHEAFTLLAARLKKLDAATTVWNGDLCSAFNTLEQMRSMLLNPGESSFATSRPFMFVPGNHDYRGIVARELPRFLLTRDPLERSNRHTKLDRNFAVRQGDIAMIGLDTGEDKPDWREEWAQLAQFEPYRALQTEWLAEVLERPEIKSAPYIVAFCHIPIFDADPKSNPGDTASKCDYRVNYAQWNKWCYESWGPLLQRYGVQVAITAHRHRFRYDAPGAGRSWAHIVNGAGCDTPPKGQLTVLDGKVENNNLKITVHNLTDNTTLGTYNFKPRKV